MIVHIIFVACLLSAAIVRGAAPVISSFDKVVTLYEGTKVNQPLSTITCSDPDGDLTKVVVRSMSPPGPRSNCYEILDCPPAECLQYRAGVGTLSYSSAQLYLLTISCDDNKGSSVTEVVQVNIQPNSPPYFQPDVKFLEKPLTGREGPNTMLYNVDDADDEGDSITYSMTVVPSTSSSNYRIDPLTGEIFSTVDLRSECRNDVTFLVTINDGKSTNGPLVISAPFSNPNVAPVAMNLDTTVMIPEDSPGTAYTMKFTDGNNDPLTYTYTANNAAGVAQFKLDGKSPYNIDVAGALDYENAALRQTDLVVTASDGFCTSPPASLRLRVTDVNEKPTITPVDGSVQVCEGQREFDPGYKVTDPDNPDTITWSFSPKTSNSKGQFSINPQTGALITLVNYDVDGDKPDHTTPMPTTNTFIVVATDKGGLTATATVTATFLDCNDNAPIMKEPAYERATTECTVGGSRLGSITATDKDISAPNNVIYYEGSGGAVQIGTGGEIIVNQPLPAGSVVTFKAYAWDRGVNPGPLRSAQPTVISVRFTPCPTPPPPQTPAPATPQPPPTTTTTTPKPATTSAAKSFKKVDSDPNLPWIIIAALLGAFMLGLLSYMLWRYGRLCADACRNINCGKTCRGRPPGPKKVVEREYNSNLKRLRRRCWRQGDSWRELECDCTTELECDCTTELECDCTTELECDCTTQLECDCTTELECDCTTELECDCTTELECDCTTELECDCTTELECDCTTELECDCTTELECDCTTELECDCTTELECDCTTELECDCTTELECDCTTELECDCTTELECVSTTELECDCTTELECDCTTELECDCTTELECDCTTDLKCDCTTELECDCTTELE